MSRIEITTNPTPDASVIWLHGLGADGHDFEPLVAELGLPDTLGIRFLFPDAPVRPVTINGGLQMRAWYDFLSLDLGKGENREHITEAADLVRALIDAERGRGIAPARIILGGFSQGGVVSMLTALNHPERLGGVVALSSYLPLRESMRDELTEANRGLPLFMGHGSEDPLIPLAHAEQSRDWLKDLGYAVDWHLYTMPHSVCPAEIVDLRSWLLDRLGLET